MGTVSSQGTLTELLHAWHRGDPNALARVVELCYMDLRKIARGCLKGERSDHTVQATALVHEAYLRLNGARQVSWQDRAHFFAIASKLMRRALTEHARARDSQKRGGGACRATLNEALISPQKSDPDLIKLDDALEELTKCDSRKAQVVELRYFGGLTTDEIAEVLHISRESVNRDWSLAKAWLSRAMSRENCDGSSSFRRH